MRMKGGWSTREIAEFAGTTVKTVRHYHSIGLLEEPERSANGYKRYGVKHLMRLMRIRRLVDLGVALSDIAAMRDSVEGVEHTLRALDAELAASIERQQRMRAELAAILRNPDLADVSPGFDEHVGELTEADRGLLLIGPRVFDPEMMELIREADATPRTPVAREFDTLAADAGDDARQELAERYAAQVLTEFAEKPALREATDRIQSGGNPDTQPVLLHAIVELFNPAQIDVLQRMNAIIYPSGD